MERRWKSRWIEKADLEKLDEFRQSIHNGDIYADTSMANYYEWKYFKGAPEPACVRVAEDNGKIVGTSAATLKRIAIRGKIMPCAEIGDAFTHPDYRLQGMFTTLGRELMDGLRKKDIRFVYARPNANSYPGFVRKFGFENVLYLTTMRRIINIDNILRRKTGDGLLYGISRPIGSMLAKTVYRIGEYRDLPNITVSEIAAFDDRVGILSNEVSDDYPLMIVRDDEYLNWRYVDKPVNYKIFAATENDVLRGYVVVRCIEFEPGIRKYGYLVDMLTGKDDVELIGVLMGRAMQYFSSENVDVANTWVTKDVRPATSSYYHGLRKAGFASVGDNLYFVAYTDLPEVKKLMHEAKPADWFFRFGDTDGI